MADKNLQEGDEVSWKWGTSEPTGTIAEIKTEGKLEIETKGKLVHRNADPSNPAVHVQRTGNDVVKRASELTKLSSSPEGDSAGASGQGENVEAHTTTEHQGDINKKDKQQSTEKQTLKKRAPRKKSNATTITGEKRAAEEAAGGDELAGEGSPVKKTKKAKATETGDGSVKKGPGRPRKGSKANKAQGNGSYTEGNAVDADANVVSGEGDTTNKKTPRQNKKSDASDNPPTEIVPRDADAPAANTRSKD